MSFFLNKAEEHLEKGFAAQTAGNLKDARQQFLLAAQYLTRAAEQSEGGLRETRLRMAGELLDRAKELENQVAREQPVRARQAASVDEDAAEWLVGERPSVRFADVAGLDGVKEEIKLKMVYPFTHPEAAQKYGIREGGGILLYGPPGTGKTLIARAVAGEIDAAFFTVKPSQIMSQWVGVAEQNMAKLFAAAHAQPRAVIFIDEVEALISRRRDSASTVMKRLVPQILAELEGFERKEGALLFIGATNEPWSLDPAVMRPGRFDDKIYVPLPDFDARRRILELNLAGRPLAADVSLDALAERTAGYSGADIVNVCHKASKIPFLEVIREGTERDIEPRDFETVMAKVRPSVEPKELSWYEKFSFGE
jgi:transitional endoplasmic reticulum ATPase